MQPRQESRIESLEKRTTTVEATLIELSSDTAEELKAIRTDMKASFKQIGDTIVKIEEAMATKDDVSQLRDEMKSDMAAMESRINQGIADLKTGLLEALRDLQQKPGE
jgi:uncharacterized phage infection (PIP) family protein YhgE